MHMNNYQRRQAVIGAINYANFDKSDPFTFSRAMSHINSGVAHCITERAGKVDVDGGYTAEPYQETRKLPDGREYNVTAYKNARRP